MSERVTCVCVCVGGGAALAGLRLTRTAAYARMPEREAMAESLERCSRGSSSRWDRHSLLASTRAKGTCSIRNISIKMRPGALADGGSPTTLQKWSTLMAMVQGKEREGRP